MGLLLAVVVHPANIQDRDGARLVIDKLIGRFPRLRLIWADAGYSGQLVDWVMSMSGWVLEIVKRPRASRHVRDDEAHPREQLSLVPFHLGHHPPSAAPTLSTIPKVVV